MRKKIFTQKDYFDRLRTMYNDFGFKGEKWFKIRSSAKIDDTNATMKTSECLNYIVDYLLGPGWYCMDTGTQEQCNPLILEAIMDRYKGN